MNLRLAPTAVEIRVLVSFNCQLQNLESPKKRALVKEPSKSDWAVRMSVVVVLTVINIGRLSLLWVAPFLRLGVPNSEREVKAS